MDEGEQAAVASFMEITGSDDATAQHMLQASAWQLDAAVELFFTTGADSHVGMPDSTAAGAGGTGDDGDIDAATAAAIAAAATEEDEPAGRFPGPGSDTDRAPTAAAATTPASDYDQEGVRAPLPVVRDTLYGDAHVLNRATRQTPSIPHVDAFRDYGAEAAAAAASRQRQQQQWQQQLQQQRQGGMGDPFPALPSAAADAGGTGPGVASGVASEGVPGTASGDWQPVPNEIHRPSLSTLFQPPHDILFNGSFEQAKQHAAQQARWLLVNVQAPSEFASLLLNRDVWSVPAVKEMIGGCFVLYQIDNISPEGSKVCTYYQLHSCPVIMVVHPRTGQRKKMWEGAVQPEKLLEDLTPYLDAPPSSHMPPPTKKPRDAAAAGTSTSGAAVPPTTASPSLSHHPSNHVDDEEEEMRRAIAASLENGASGSSQDTAAFAASAAAGPGDASAAAGNDAAAAAAGKPVDTPVSEAKLESIQLEEEPAPSAPGVCRIAVRCPDGKRLQRRFLRSQPAKQIIAFCQQEVEEAKNGRSFHLSSATPGGDQIGATTESTIDEMGLANSLVSVVWD